MNKLDIMMNLLKFRSVCRKSAVAVALLLGLGADAPFANAQSEYWKARVSLFDLLPINSDDVVFLGNSITDGGEFHELLGRNDVRNRGIQSDVISGVKKRLDQVTDGHPRKIFLLIGINDVSHALSARQIADSYSDLVKEIRKRSPETKLYIQSVMPIDNGFRRYKNLIGRENVIPELNKKLKTIAAENGAVYVDLWPALADSRTGKLRKGFTFDGLHLSGKGYKAWMDAIQPFIDD